MKKIQCQLTASRDDAADEQADRAAADRHEDVGAHGLGALGRLGELGHDHRDDHRRRDGAAHALHEASGDQQRSASSASPHTAEASVNSVDAGEEDALAADQVAEPAGEQQEAAERDQVGVDDPGQLGLGDVQVALDDGQRDVDDGAVERVHEHRHADDAQGDPAPAVAGARGRDCTHRSAL